MNKIAKFDEFLNEGLIADYKKQKEIEEREISSSDKSFLASMLKEFDEVELPYVLIYKNGAFISDNVKRDYAEELRKNVVSSAELDEGADWKDFHVSEKSYLVIFKDYADGHEALDCGKDEFKNIWGKIYEWFSKKYEKEGLSFGGKIKVGRIIEFKDDIKKELL